MSLKVPRVGDVKVYFGENTVADASLGKVNASDAEISCIYDVTGMKVNEMTPGRVYIVKMTDGTCRKIVK